jgi:hypothetical protein
MLTRRLLSRQLGASGAFTRSLSTTAPVAAQVPEKSPALGDITPNGGPSFDKKKTEFRERLVAEQEARRRKEQQESTCI